MYLYNLKVYKIALKKFLICYLIFINDICKMASISKQAFVKASSKTGHDVSQNFRRDLCHLFSYSSFKIILSGVWCTLLLIYHRRKKSQAVKSGERGGRGMFPFREIMRFGNKSFRLFILTLAVRLVTPSC